MEMVMLLDGCEVAGAHRGTILPLFVALLR
jgi:hypothetical protein